MTGAVIASGRDADVFAFGEGRVLRRYRNGGDVRAEVQVMRHAAAQGFPVPVVHHARGADVVMERLDGPSMLSALATGDLEPAPAGALLADLHRRLHEVPAPWSSDPTVRLLHLDLHPDNVMLTSRGPVVIDWRNAREGAADLDVAMSAVIIAQVAVDAAQAMPRLAAALLAAFLRSAAGISPPTLDEAVALRQGDAGLTADERDLVPAAAALIRRAG